MLQLMLSASIVSVLAQVALHFLWQGALLGLSAACLLHVWPIRTPQARYAFHCGLLLLLAACPPITWTVVQGEAMGTAALQGDSADAEVTNGLASATRAGDAEAIAMRPRDVQSPSGQSGLWSADWRAPLTEWQLVLSGPDKAWRHELIVAIWLTGTCLMTARLLLGAVGLHLLARRRMPIPLDVARLAERLSRQLGFRAQPALHAVERVSQAMAVGIFRPMVLLPASWVSELPHEVLEAVIAHELAHLRRWDLPTNFVQRVVEALLFFHPVVWWCSRQLRREREMCCDELAQAAIGSRVVYAQALTYLAHQQCSTVESLLAAGIGGAKMVLLERIRNVLKIKPGHRGRLYGPSCALVGAVASSLVWMAVWGVPEKRQPANSSAAAEVTIAARADDDMPAAAAEQPQPADSIEQCTPLDGVASGPERPKFKDFKLESYWDLSLDETVAIAKANAKTPRSAGEHAANSAAGQHAQTDEARQTPHSPGAETPGNGTDNPAESENCQLNLLKDAKSAYWELAFTWRNLETAQTALNSARQTWKKIHLLYVFGTKGGEAKEEAQAREQYYQFKSQTQTLLNELFRAENRLRYIMGLSPTDGRLIRPIDKPTVAKVEFDWQEITEEALARSLDLRRQKWRIKQRELELIAAKNLLLPRVDLSGTYRWLGLGQTLIDSGARAYDVNDKAAGLLNTSSLGTLASGQFQEWQLGVQATMPIGFRKELATVRNYQLNLARERARLQDEELEVSHQLADAVRQLELNYELTQTNFNRTLAADRQVEAVQAAFEAETVTLDQLLEAQRRRAEAQVSYFRTLNDYQRAIIGVHFRKGSLLEYNNVYLEEGPWPAKAQFDAHSLARQRDAGLYMNYGFTRPDVISQGPIRQMKPGEELGPEGEGVETMEGMPHEAVPEELPPATPLGAVDRGPSAPRTEGQYPLGRQRGEYAWGNLGMDGEAGTAPEGAMPTRQVADRRGSAPRPMRDSAVMAASYDDRSATANEPVSRQAYRAAAGATASR